MHSSSNNVDHLVVKVSSATYRQPSKSSSSSSSSSSNSAATASRRQQQQFSPSPRKQQQQQGNNNKEGFASSPSLSSTSTSQGNCIQIDAEFLLVYPPREEDLQARKREYYRKPQIEYGFSNAPSVSETGVNPEKLYDLQSSGQYHFEGGWPRETDASDPEHRLRHLRRARKEASFLSTVKELVNRSIPIVKSNNAIDIYHSMFSDLIEGKLGQGTHGDISDLQQQFEKQQQQNAMEGKRKKKKNNNNNNEDMLFGGGEAGGGDDFDEDHDDDDEDDDDEDEAHNNNNKENSGEGEEDLSPRKRRQLRREREKEQQAKKAQTLAEDLQVASLAGRTVGLNATGVFRDAPRAFPCDLLGTEVKNLVRSEQRRILEQKTIDISNNMHHPNHHHSSSLSATAAAGGGGGGGQGFGSNEFPATSSLSSQSATASAAESGSGSSSYTPSSHPTSPTSAVPGDVIVRSPNKQVVLGPCAAFSSQKVVSSLSWVSKLDIPGASPPGGCTTLAVALASVANTPHLALLSSSSTAELKAQLASSSFMNDSSSSSSSNRKGNDSRRASSATAAGGTAFNSHGSHGHSNFISASEITMAGVDLFPTSLIYDASSPQAPLLRLKTASDLVQLEFSPRDLPLLASGSSDGTISLFDLRRGAARCLVVADVCNAGATLLSQQQSSSHSHSGHHSQHQQQQQLSHPNLQRGGGGGVTSAASSSSGGGGSHSNQQHQHQHQHAHKSGNRTLSSSRRNPLNPVVALRWIPSNTGGGARCSEFATCDLSPFVRIWDTRFVSRGCLDMFNLSSGAVLASVADAGLEVYSSSSNSNSNSNSASSLAMLRAVSLDVQQVSNRVYIGTTDGKVFAFTRKGRTDSDRICGVFQIVPREMVFLNSEVYIHVAAHPTLPKCFAAASEWGVHVYADDLPRPVAILPPQHQAGAPTSIRWVPHCAALLSVARVGGVVELWDVCVMLTSLPDVAEKPKASTLIMEYSQGEPASSSSFENNYNDSSSSSSSTREHKFDIRQNKQQHFGSSSLLSSFSSSSSSVPAVAVLKNTVDTNNNNNNTSSGNSSNNTGPPLSALRFSPDGTNLVAGLLDGSATLLDVTVQDDPSLVDAAERAAAACGPKGVAPVQGARALEHVCFSRIMEKRGALRAKRLMKLAQQAAPDITQTSAAHYEHQDNNNKNSSSSKNNQKNDENENNNNRNYSAGSGNGGGATMSGEELTLDMSRLSHHYTQSVAQETSTTVSTTTATNNNENSEQQQQQQQQNSSYVSPFRSNDGKTLRAMDRVGNMLYNPSFFNSSSSSSSSSSLVAPLATDESAVEQLARAIETGVAVAPQKTVSQRRWSSVRRNLAPGVAHKTETPEQREMSKPLFGGRNMFSASSASGSGGGMQQQQQQSSFTTTVVSSSSSKENQRQNSPPPSSSSSAALRTRPRSSAVRLLGEQDEDDASYLGKRFLDTTNKA